MPPVGFEPTISTGEHLSIVGQLYFNKKEKVGLYMPLPDQLAFLW